MKIRDFEYWGSILLTSLCAGDMVSMKTYVSQLYNAKFYFFISKS